MKGTQPAQAGGGGARQSLGAGLPTVPPIPSFRRANEDSGEHTPQRRRGSTLKEQGFDLPAVAWSHNIPWIRSARIVQPGPPVTQQAGQDLTIGLMIPELLRVRTAIAVDLQKLKQAVLDSVQLRSDRP